MQVIVLPLGAPQSFMQVRSALRGGMNARIYQVKYPNKNLVIVTYQTPNGKIEQYLVLEH